MKLLVFLLCLSAVLARFCHVFILIRGVRQHSDQSTRHRNRLRGLPLVQLLFLGFFFFFLGTPFLQSCLLDLLETVQHTGRLSFDSFEEGCLGWRGHRGHLRILVVIALHMARISFCEIPLTTDLSSANGDSLGKAVRRSFCAKEMILITGDSVNPFIACCGECLCGSPLSRCSWVFSCVKNRR